MLCSKTLLRHSLWLAALCLTGCASSRPQTPHMGSAQDRLDHNRSCWVTTPAIMAGQPFRAGSLAYAPHRWPVLPEITLVGQEPAPDGLPTGQLVPVFTGLRLPLSEARGGCERSDLEDLVDYLARGPDSHHGVDPLPTWGNVAAGAAPYAPMLELLGSTRLSAMDVASIRAWAAAHHAKAQDLELDARYLTAWFTAAIAIRFGEFYFALYRPQTAAGWSRLVVFPVNPGRLDFTLPLGSLEPFPKPE